MLKYSSKGPHPFSPSRQGFEPLAEEEMFGSGHIQGDVANSIPMTDVNSQGYGRTDSMATSMMQEKLVSTEVVNPKTLGHRVKKEKNQGRIGVDGELNTLNRMGRFYNKVFNFSIFTRYFMYILPLASCIAVPIVVGATAAQNARIGGVRIVWLFVWIEIGTSGQSSSAGLHD